jgi:hypothetical protein
MKDERAPKRPTPLHNEPYRGDSFAEALKDAHGLAASNRAAHVFEVAGSNRYRVGRYWATRETDPIEVAKLVMDRVEWSVHKEPLEMFMVATVTKGGLPK